MPDIPSDPMMPPQPEGKPRFLVFTFLAFSIAAILIFLNVGRWLVREDPLEKAAAIAVLSGRMPDRALEAARIYRQGFAAKIWLTHSTEPGAALQKLSIPFTGEETYNKLLLVHEGVPESAITLLEPPIVNTVDEMRNIEAALRREQNHTVIIVTSKVHTRRTGILWKKLTAGTGRAIVRGVSNDEFDPQHWWGTTRDALDVVREVLGLLNAWAGFPLQPAA
jgi:uncharacterized SAM-binding protein YcdF (DUF218 family)